MESENRRSRGRGRRGYQNQYRSRGAFEQDQPLRKPTFKKVSDISPEMTGVNIKLKVVSRPQNSNEVLMGDDTGNVVVVVKKESLLQSLVEGAFVIVRNGFVHMKDDTFIQLTTNEWGKVEVSPEPFDFSVSKGNNISEVEYAIE